MYIIIHHVVCYLTFIPKLLDFAAGSSVFVCINRRSTERRGQLAADLVEGNSIRAAGRTTGDLENRRGAENS